MRGMVEREAQHDERPDVGPDPVWGLGVFIIGLFTMAMAGAFTWHWVFVIGEAFLLLGVVWFLAAVARTRHKQDPIVWREKLPAFLGGTAAEEPSAKPRRAKRKKAPEARAKKKKKKKTVKKAKRRKRVAREGD